MKNIDGLLDQTFSNWRLLITVFFAIFAIAFLISLSLMQFQLTDEKRPTHLNDSLETPVDNLIVQKNTLHKIGQSQNAGSIIREAIQPNNILKAKKGVNELVANVVEESDEPNLYSATESFSSNKLTAPSDGISNHYTKTTNTSTPRVITQASIRTSSASTPIRNSNGSNPSNTRLNSNPSTSPESDNTEISIVSTNQNINNSSNLQDSANESSFESSTDTELAFNSQSSEYQDRQQDLLNQFCQIPIPNFINPQQISIAKMRRRSMGCPGF